jgi:hypothetical protein
MSLNIIVILSFDKMWINFCRESMIEMQSEKAGVAVLIVPKIMFGLL